MSDRPSALLMTVLAIGIALLYIPMLVMIGYSFNASPLVGVWGGLSTHWYAALAANDQLKAAAWLSLTAFLALVVLYFVGVDQGATSVFGDNMYIHEFVHDARHLLGFPCH